MTFAVLTCGSGIRSTLCSPLGPCTLSDSSLSLKSCSLSIAQMSSRYWSAFRCVASRGSLTLDTVILPRAVLSLLPPHTVSRHIGLSGPVIVTASGIHPGTATSTMKLMTSRICCSVAPNSLHSLRQASS